MQLLHLDLAHNIYVKPANFQMDFDVRSLNLCQIWKAMNVCLEKIHVIVISVDCL